MVLGKIPGRDGLAIRRASPLGFFFDIRRLVRSGEVCAAHHLRRKDLIVVQPISQHQLFLDMKGNMSPQKGSQDQHLASTSVCMACVNTKPPKDKKKTTISIFFTSSDPHHDISF